MTIGTSSGLWRRLRALAGGVILAAALLGLAVQPAGATTTTVITNQGVGTLTATLKYPAPGAAPLNADCKRDLTFSVEAASVLLAVNVQTQVDPAKLPIVGTDPGPGNGVGDDGFAGMITDVAGAGGGPGSCEGTSSGNGTLNLTVPTDKSTDNINGTDFGCDGSNGSTALSGNYTRVGTNMTAILFGKCHVNQNAVHIVFLFDGEWTPDGIAGLTLPGITEATMSATVRGAVTVLPFG